MTHTIQALRPVTVILRLDDSKWSTAIHMEAGQIHRGVVEIIMVRDARSHVTALFHHPAEAGLTELAEDFLSIQATEE